MDSTRQTFSLPTGTFPPTTTTTDLWTNNRRDRHGSFLRVRTRLQGSCHSKNNNNTVLRTLDDKSTQHIIFNRLSYNLKTKWFDKQEEFIDVYGNSPFHKFVEWIVQKAKTAHRNRASLQPEPMINQEPQNHLNRPHLKSAQIQNNESGHYTPKHNKRRRQRKRRP